MGSGGWQHGGAAASFVEGGRGRGAAPRRWRQRKNKKKRVQLRGQATGEERGEGEAGGGSNQPGHVLPTPRLRPSGNWITRWMDG